MVDADERCSLGHAVALQHCKTQTLPELFCVGVERCSARYECPELPAEATVNLTKGPPAAKKMLMRSECQLSLKACYSTARLHLSFYLLAQRVKNARDCGDDGDALALYRFNYL